ncbi:response regulator [Muricauda sp. TY007]|uniref:response regulator n=1 Tax=Allomuricauda sp. TY007 TaxID=2683200 RepID=UPI0013C213EC|nr:response regulator [Muricauda sp. TY007]NDV17600.1 response regulator [Muricauda sp. TY007]
MIDELLLIDDDAITNFVNQNIVEPIFKNITISVFYNGSQALDHILSNPSVNYLIFLDLNMPVMNGWEFLEALMPHKDKLHLTIHIISSSIDPEDINRAKVHPLVKSFIEKPLDHDALNAIIDW